MTGSILSRFHRTGEHFTGESVADLVERRERERAAEMAARQQWRRDHPAAPPETEAEKTQPLFRVGDAREVFRILGGRGLDIQVVEKFDDQPCAYCWNYPVQPTSVRITGDREQEECCIKPQCFHEALRFVNSRDLSADRDIVVEIARRPKVIPA